MSQQLHGFRHACFGMPALTLRAERKGCWDVPGSSSQGDWEHKRAGLLVWLEGASCFRMAGIFDTVAVLSFVQLMRSAFSGGVSVSPHSEETWYLLLVHVG